MQSNKDISFDIDSTVCQTSHNVVVRYFVTHISYVISVSTDLCVEVASKRLLDTC